MKDTISYFSCWIYIVIGLIFLIQILKSNSGNSKKSSGLCFLVIYLFAFFRYEIGYDYTTYWNIVTNVGEARDDFEPLSQIIITFVKDIGFPPLVFIIYSTISLLSYKKVIERYSTLPALSWYFYFSYPMFFIQDCSTIRQSAAMGLFFLTYMYIDIGHTKKALLTTLIASFMHSSGISALLLFFTPICKKISLKSNIIMLCASFFAGKVILTVITQYLAGVAMVQRFLYYTELDMDGFVIFQYIMYAIVLVNFVFYNKLILIDKRNALYITFVNAGLCFYNLFLFESQTAIRMANFFMLFELFILPSYIPVLRHVIKEQRTIKCLLFTAMFTLQLLMVCTYIKGYNNRTVDRGTYVPYKTWLFEQW